MGVGYWGGGGWGLGQIYRRLARSSPTSGWPASLVAPSSRSMASGSAGPVKRGRDDGVDQGDSESITRSDLDILFNTFKTSFRVDIIENVENSRARKMEDLIRGYDGSVQKRLGDHDAQLRDLDSRTQTIETSQASMKSDIKRLTEALALAESATTSAEVTRAFADESFDRLPGLSVIRFNTSELVSHSSILESIKPFMGEADLSENQWDLLGAPLGISRNSIVRFTGSEAIAARRAKTCFQLRRLPDGSWRSNPKVTSPMNREIDVYISPDKSPKQLRTELGGRRLRKAFRAAHPNGACHLDKRTGQVSVQWKPCARLAPQPSSASDAPDVIQWNAAAVSELQVSEPQIQSAFDSEWAVRALCNGRSDRTQILFFVIQGRSLPSLGMQKHFATTTPKFGSGSLGCSGNS